MPVRFMCLFVLAAVPLAGPSAEPAPAKSVAQAQLPHYGNKVDHAALFGATARTIPDAPPRVWRISPAIYRELWGAKSNVPSPFAVPPNHGFKDYSADAGIDEPTAAQLIRNAQALVAKQTAFTTGPDGKLKVQNGSIKEFCELLNPGRTPTRADHEKAIARQFQTALKRTPTKDETDRFVALFEKNVADAGRTEGVRTTLSAILLHPEALFRSERGAGSPDADGLVMLTPRELAFAVAYAVGDRGPDAQLLAAADKGQLKAPAQIAAQLQRLWADPKLPKTRMLRFFHEYFEYHLATEVFKDKKLNKDHNPRALVEDTDRLVQYILDQDKNVLYELLTTNKSFVAYGYDSKKKTAVETGTTGGNKTAPRAAYNVAAWTAKQPMELPKEQRAGVLTQPSWLVAHSTNFDNHAILRGKWVREKLLGNYVPDLPITVDAQLPDDPKRTLRDRMTVTQDAYCWACHEKMNDLGLPFEMYDHFGRFRTEELGKPVDATGEVALTGDEKIEGKVTNAVEMLHKLAKTDRVRQVFVRHAFRYWMGRNETLGDAWSLVQADKAYVESGGSMKALVTAIVTSDSFLYRRVR